MSLSDLPAVNACLNSLSTLLLSSGYFFIKRRNRVAHQRCMIAAFVTSAAFLASYLVYHFFAGRTDFQNPEWFRPFYLLLLLTHVVLAIVIVPLVGITLVLGIRSNYEAHRKIARWTWPIWMYVSVTGVAIYLLLYQVFPQHGPPPG